MVPWLLPFFVYVVPALSKSSHIVVAGFDVLSSIGWEVYFLLNDDPL